MTCREHPLRILRYSMKNIWLLIFPLLRGVSVFHFDPAGMYAWVKGAWMDIAVLGIILVYGYIRWYFSEITVTDEAITHSEGFIVKIRRTIPFEKISSAATETPFYLMPFKAVTVRCDTGAGIFKSTDLKIMVTQKSAEALVAHIPDVKKENALKDLPKPSVASVLLFSVFFSSGFSGAVYIAAFFFKGGDIAHDLLSIAMSRITEQAEHIYVKLLSGIPKAAAMAGMFFIGAWLLSFIMNLLRYSYFQISADKDCINVAFGLVKRRRHRIMTKYINYIDLRQNLIMKLCGAVTMNISCPGYGYDSHLPVLMPISREKNLGSFNEYWSLLGDGRLKYRPRFTAFFSYAGLPAAGIVLSAILHRPADMLPPNLAELSLFLTIMAEIPLTWLTMVKTVTLCTSGLSIYDDRIVLRCSKGTSFHTVIAQREKVVMVQIKQNILQKIFKKCQVVIWLSGESRSRYKVKSLTAEQGIEIKKLLSDR